MPPQQAANCSCTGDYKSLSARVGGQGPPSFKLLRSGLVKGEAGKRYHRNIYTTAEDRTDRMLDLREVVKVKSCPSNFMLPLID